MEKVIFIDRDGVINEDPIGDYIKRWEDFRFIPGVVDALRSLVKDGYEIVVVSNQAGIGDGAYSESTLNQITTNMVAQLKRSGIRIRGIYYCLHGKTAGCECRKPKTGLFDQAARDISFDASKTYFIGDKASDVEAGCRFGLQTLFVLTGHGTNDQKHLDGACSLERIFPSLREAVPYVIAHEL